MRITGQGAVYVRTLHKLSEDSDSSDETEDVPEISFSCSTETSYRQSLAVAASPQTDIQGWCVTTYIKYFTICLLRRRDISRISRIPGADLLEVTPSQSQTVWFETIPYHLTGMEIVPDHRTIGCRKIFELPENIYH